MYRLLNEYRQHVGNANKMMELKNAIESLSLESFTDPSTAFRRYPALMGKLIQPDKINAKDFILAKKAECQSSNRY